MHRTVGVTLRLTVGGAAIFAVGFGAPASVPQRAVTETAAAAVVPLGTPIERLDEPTRHQPRAAVMIYQLATPEPNPTVAPPPVVAARLTARSAAPVPSSAAGPVSAGPVSGAANGFSYGYCTWWVAHRRYIPWRGNAAEWWWTARPFGVTEGQTPRAGAVMVMGYSGSSPQGHVGYVESVNPDGSFVVSEMNWWGVPGGGWNRVDYRRVTSMRGILGFIY